MVKAMDIQHYLSVRRRAFAIWQKVGFNPWKKPKEPKKRIFKKSSGDFYKGAFDGIPFLNEDAKRTFTHLILRPGYMIRDYIKGERDKYLAPLTSLIVFFAFFALLSSILQPIQQKKTLPFNADNSDIEVKGANEEKMVSVVKNTIRIVQGAYTYLHLDEFPDEVDTPQETSLAAVERNLRSQGIPLFLSKFFFLWFAMAIALRRQKTGMPACAAASAYVLCQFCFFMMFAVLLTFGKSTSISVVLMLLLLLIDYHQWLDTSYKKSFKLALSTGIHYVLLYAAMLVVVTAVVVTIAYFKS